MPHVNRTGKPGRPAIELTPELQNRICDALAGCARLSVAASVSGVSKSLLLKWMRRGRKSPRSGFGQFVRAIQEAEDRAELRLSALLAKNAQTDTVDAKWLLTHRPKWKDRWADKERHELSGKVKLDGPLGIVVLPAEEP